MAERVVVDACLAALVSERVVNANYVENFRRHVEVVLDTAATLVEAGGR